MGERKLVDKKVYPMTSPVSLSPAHLTNRSRESLGIIPIGVYKGVAAFWDLDKAVNQPGVLAEQKHILGILDGRAEERDLLTIAFDDEDGETKRKRIQVPSNEVWYINAVTLTVPSNGTANWKCNLWPDLDGDPADEDGQRFYENAQTDTTALAEFGPIATAWSVTNKTELLRLPGGSKLTLVATAGDGTSFSITLAINGFKAKKLVD